MRTNHFYFLIIAILIHSIPLAYFLAKNKRPKSNTSSLIANSENAIELNRFSIISNARKRPSNPVQLSNQASIQQSKKHSEVGIENTSSQATNSSQITKETIYLKYEEPEYPIIARKKNQEGRVKIKAFYNINGIIESIEVLESSGFKSIDQNVVSTVKKWVINTNSPGNLEKTFDFKLNNN